MSNVKIIAMFDAPGISHAQNLIKTIDTRPGIQYVTLYIIDSTITSLGFFQTTGYTQIHIPLIAIASKTSTGSVDVEFKETKHKNVDKFEFTLINTENCFVFQHLKSNSHNESNHKIKILFQGLIGGLISSDFTLDNSKLAISDPANFELNGTDTKPPCNKTSVLVV